MPKTGVDLLEDTPSQLVNLLAEGEEGATTMMNHTTSRGERDTFRMLNNQQTYTAHHLGEQNKEALATGDSAAQMITEQDFANLHKPSPNEFALAKKNSCSNLYFSDRGNSIVSQRSPSQVGHAQVISPLLS